VTNALFSKNAIVQWLALKVLSCCDERVMLLKVLVGLE
jgi:hypothetical protein